MESLDALGQELARRTRAGTAPNQRPGSVVSSRDAGPGLPAGTPVPLVRNAYLADLSPDDVPPPVILAQYSSHEILSNLGGELPPTDRQLGDELSNLLIETDAMYRISVSHGADLPEARFRADGGVPVLEVPPAARFQSGDHQATSIAHACAHASLYVAALTRSCSLPPGTPSHQARSISPGSSSEPAGLAERRVAAYQDPGPEHSAERSSCDLSATYAAVRRVTAMGATYVPPASTRAPDQIDRWAGALEQPGAAARVAADVGRVEFAQAEARHYYRESRVSEIETADYLPEALQEGRKPVAAGGDPGVEPPAARPSPSVLATPVVALLPAQSRG